MLLLGLRTKDFLHSLQECDLIRSSIAKRSAYHRLDRNGVVKHKTMEVSMERHDNRDQELIDLGAASIETRGPLGGNIDGVAGYTPLGLSDSED